MRASDVEPPAESRIPVFRSGIPLAFGVARGRSQLPVRPVRPTALAGLTASRPSVAESPVSPSDQISAAHLGCEVIVAGSKPGILKFYGTLPFDTGLWCGVELHKPEGLNDGSVRGVRLFTCRPLHGVVAPVGKVRLLPGRPESAEDEEDGSTPREAAVEEGWSAEEEGGTPPAELREDSCPRTPKTDTTEEEEDRCLAISPASLPTPVTPRTLDWSHPDPKEEEDSTIKKRTLHSSSPGSNCEYSAPAHTSTPISGERGTGRCRRGRHNTGCKQVLEESCGCGFGLSKQSSFELDESLGILTPDQMMDIALEAFSRTPSREEERVPVEEGKRAEERSDEEEEELRMEVDGKDARDGGPAPLASDNTPSAATAAPLSRPTQVAPCFVASVTSITSIDPGYQGDGEWSRPASRADNSPSAPSGGNGGLSVDVLKIKFETMTDSDFYSDTGACGTESDADHEEVAGRDGPMAQGDRRAQVIDGTLYGGISGQQGSGGMFGGSHQQPPPRCFAAVMTSSTATTTEEMESSGVFSDLERRTDSSSHGGTASASAGGGDSGTEGFLPQRHSRGPFPRPSSAQGITSSAAESDAPQSPLEELPEDPKDVSFEAINQSLSTERVDGEQCDSLETTLGSTQMDVTLPEDALEETIVKIASETVILDSTRSSESHEQTLIQTPTASSSAVPASSPSSANKKEIPASRQKTSAPTPSKKYKMPKRNVASKIKAMIESKEDGSKEEVENRRQSRTQAPKKGRWDAIMSKIAAGQAEQRTSRPRLREVKSRVLAGIGSPAPNTSAAPTEENDTSTRAKKPFVSNVTRTRRAETRRTRARGLEGSSLRDATCTNGNAATSGGVGGSTNNSVHSSLSDVSGSQGAIPKASRSSKKREAGRSASPFSDGSSNSGASNVPRVVTQFHQAAPRQTSHPKREHTREKTANPNALMMASTTASAAVLRKNLRNNQMSPCPTATPKRPVVVQRRAQTERAPVTEMRNPSVRKAPTRHLASSASQVKSGPMRDNNRGQNKNGSGGRGNSVVVVQRQHMPPAEPVGPLVTASITAPVVMKVPPPIHPNIHQELKHSAAGVEALGTLVQYLVFDLDAFSTPYLKKMVENLKIEMINTKLSLDEAMASCRQLSETAEIAEIRNKDLIKKHEEAMSEIDIRLNSQIEETQCRYEEELKRRDRLSSRNTEALLEDVKLYAERAEKAEKEKEELKHVHAQLQKEIGEMQEKFRQEIGEMQEKFRQEIDDMQEKFRQELAEVSRTGESGKLRDEIRSLQTVLDMRTKEMHEYRKKAEEWCHKSEALNSAVARAAALQARVEDLEAQLQRKSTCERKLQEKVLRLSESVERECRQNEQLALENEVLEWKVNESTKIMSTLTAQTDVSSSMPGSLMASSTASSDRHSAMARSLGSPDSPPAFMFPRFSPRLSPKSPISDISGTLELEDDEEEEEEEEEDEEELEEKLMMEGSQMSPKVRPLVEKSESISWLVEMEEVIPASIAIQGSALHRLHSKPSSPLDLLPRLPQDSPPTAHGGNSPSTSPTSSDPSSNMFCSKSQRGKGMVPPSKKTRLERGKRFCTSTPMPAPSQGHNHHRHPRYQHQSRATSRLPPSASTIGSSLRSRSVSTDSESMSRETASPAEHKAWRGGEVWPGRVPMLSVTATSEGKREQGAIEGQECSGAPKEEQVPSPSVGAATPMEEKAPSKQSSPFCEGGDDFSDQSPYHSKGDSNDGYVFTDDNSSSVELLMPKKQPTPPPQPPFHPLPNQRISMVDTSVMLHHHHHHYQQQHVLSSLCAHPHLSIKESAGEAMISEEISDDTQGESEEEECGREKLLDSDEEEGISCRREPPDGAAASEELRVVPECMENGGVTKCNGTRGEPLISNSIKLGQQVMTSSTPDSSHFADSSAMDLSWSEDLELMPSESEV